MSESVQKNAATGSAREHQNIGWAVAALVMWQRAPLVRLLLRVGCPRRRARDKRCDLGRFGGHLEGPPACPALDFLACVFIGNLPGFPAWTLELDRHLAAPHLAFDVVRLERNHSLREPTLQAFFQRVVGPLGATQNCTRKRKEVTPMIV